MDSGMENSGKVFDAMPGELSKQETPLRRSSKVMDSGADISGEVFDGKSCKVSRLEFDVGVSLWAGLQPDILGVVLHLLPCLADRASVRSVCRHWHASASNHVLPPALPLLVLPEFKFSSLSAKGDLTLARRVPVPKDVAADDIRCVGSFDGWLVGMTPSKNRIDDYERNADGECVLVNAFNRKVIRLPQVYNMCYNYSGYSLKTLPVINGSGEVYYRANDIYRMSFRKVVLSASPDSESKYIVAASSDHMGTSKLALWQPGMISWHICTGIEIDGPHDLTFYKGKLYVLVRFKPHLFALNVEEEDRGIMISRVERCLTELLNDHPFQAGGAISCNMVVWHGKLLLIVRHYNGSSYRAMRQVVKVEVFAADISTNPYGLTEIHSFNGDCIFVGSNGCKSFPAGLHHRVEGDLIYFVPDDWKPYDSFVYSMRDGRMRPFAVKLFACNFDVPEEYLDFPVWLFPSE